MLVDVRNPFSKKSALKEKTDTVVTFLCKLISTISDYSHLVSIEVSD